MTGKTSSILLTLAIEFITSILVGGVAGLRTRGVATLTAGVVDGRRDDIAGVGDFAANAALTKMHNMFVKSIVDRAG
jgi:hypothetical protein